MPAKKAEPLYSIPSPAYLVICAHRTGSYLPERNNLIDLTRSQTVADIAGGEIATRDIIQVIEFNLNAGTSRDVTRDFALEVMTAWAERGEPLTEDEYEFVDMFVSTQAANSFRRAA